MKIRISMFILSFLLIGHFSFLVPESAFACSCAEVSPTEAFNKSEAVFVGKVLESKQERIQDGIVGGISYRDANLFEVAEIWKGSNQSQMIIYEAGAEASCGIEFELGETYLVYTYKNDDGELLTGLCNRTIEVSKAGEDLQFLGQGEEVKQEVDLEAEMKSISNKDYDMEILIGGVVLVVIISIFLFKKLSKKRGK